jgi:hypothetical protein
MFLTNSTLSIKGQPPICAAVYFEKEQINASYTDGHVSLMQDNHRLENGCPCILEAPCSHRRVDFNQQGAFMGFAVGNGCYGFATESFSGLSWTDLPSKAVLIGRQWLLT